MQESDFTNNQDFTQPESALPQPHPRTVLLAQLGLFVLCCGIGVIFYRMVCLATGWDPSMVLRADSPISERWQWRLQLGLGHFFAFTVSGALTVWFFYRAITQERSPWLDYLKARQGPGWKAALLGVLLMLAAVPLVLFSLNINQQIPLPDAFKFAEEQAAETLKGLLQMDGVAELLANLLLMALLPAIGEELVFRGVVQQQLMRRIAQPSLAILAASIIFSAAHFQFEGFLPRLLLGYLLGWLFWQTQNFWVPVAGHFFNNAIQVIGQYLYGKQISSVDLEQDVQVPWQFAAISAFMVWAIARQIREKNTPHTNADVFP